ncbi:MAG: c-type cytochrome [Caldilineales bacterium]|nr:c-type cytochrome [Caldilineales bacterium]
MYGISRLILATAALVGMLVILLYYGAVENNRMDTYAANFTGRDIEVGADIYYQACASCHGANGEGLVGPALNSADLLVNAEGQTRPPRLIERGWSGDLRSYIEGTVTYGRVGTVMPAWGTAAGGPYRPDQIHAVASFIMNWGEDPGKKWGGAEDRIAIGGVQPVQPVSQAIAEAPPRDVQSAALGRYMFQGPAGCAECHTFDGATGTVGPNLTGVVEQFGRDYVYQSIINPESFGSGGHAVGNMPVGFGFTMTEVEIQSIIDYLENPGAAGDATGATPATQPEGPLGPENGRALAQGNACLGCHSTDGSVLVGPTWQGLYGSTTEFEDGTTAVADDAYLHESIVNPTARIVKGFSPLMPQTYGDSLTEDQITDIISYIQTLAQ